MLITFPEKKSILRDVTATVTEDSLKKMVLEKILILEPKTRKIKITDYEAGANHHVIVVKYLVAACKVWLPRNFELIVKERSLWMHEIEEKNAFRHKILC